MSAARQSPFNKVLVANRGEIAVRVMRTLREMGLQSIAVYSEADRNAMHVRYADEAYVIGEAAVDQSYLNIERLWDACVRSGAQAVHPGYGFLSEDAEFAAYLESRGVVFIGPSSAAIDAMGSKLEARKRMAAAGVPVVPGAEIQNLQQAREVAEQVGLPLLVKASAGGGGKGMREAKTFDELDAAIERAQSEAANAFGDATVYLERLLTGARHIEVQVLGDAFGNIVHLFERDCSVQRRHQKVIEESPSPAGLSPSTRAALHQAAVRAAAAVDYRSAGTIEFLVDGDNFYFLEMNTRLQVEHPITEMITGIDLVREQVRIAQGEALGYTQQDIVARGHAIECRLYAENPAFKFAPSPGPLLRLNYPEGPGVRIDAGFQQGDEISRFYDPLIAKLCVWGPDRAQAIERMRRALGECRVLGLQSNLQLLRQIGASEAFEKGRYNTRWLEQETAQLLVSNNTSEEEAVAALLVAALESSRPPAVKAAPPISRWRSAQLS